MSAARAPPEPPLTSPTAARPARRPRGIGRRAGLRGLRARLDPAPRGDRARQDRDQREGQQALQGSVVGIAAGHLRPHGAGDADARDRLAAQRPLLRTTSGSASWSRRCSVLRRRRRGVLRLSLVQAGRRRRLTWRSRRRAGPRRRSRPAPVNGTQDVYVSGAGEPVARSAPPAPGRSSEQIRADIERQRTELGRSVEALRGRVTELTDWRRQIRTHQRELADRRRGRRLRRGRPAGAAPPPLGNTNCRRVTGPNPPPPTTTCRRVTGPNPPET